MSLCSKYSGAKGVLVLMHHTSLDISVLVRLLSEKAISELRHE